MTYLQIRPYLARGAYFMLIGPLVGLALILLTLAIVYLPAMSSSDFSDAPMLLGFFLALPFYGLIVAYPVGFLPAALTGIVSKLGRNKFQEMAYAIMAGGGSCLIAGLAANDAPVFILASSLLGCLSGSICVMIRRRRDAKLASHRA